MNNSQVQSLIQLKNEFFNVFGIVPLVAYNAIGDGITDNRSAIQKAINDAIANNIKYIFVEKGYYFYLNTLKNADQVIFIGNSVNTKIRNVEIKQFPDMFRESDVIATDIVPIGAIIQTATIDIPNNYLLVDGRQLEIAKYPLLYNAIIDEEDKIDSATTFTLPSANNTTFKNIIRYR